MKIIKPLTLGILFKPYRYRQQNRLVVVTMGFFTLGEAPSSRFLTENLQWAKVMSALPAGQPLDEVMPKPRGEVLLAGKVFAPSQKPSAQMLASVQVGEVDKTLLVQGEREWMYGLLPWYRITRPQLFTEMPVDYRRSYGGPKHAGNPLGCGYSGNPWAAFIGRNRGKMPNFEYPNRRVRFHWRRYPTAGFGPLSAVWLPRKRYTGTYGTTWQTKEYPGLPSDLDLQAFQLAPEDQRIAGYFNGGERYRLQGFHPEQPLLEGVLPAMRSRAFALRAHQAADAMEEIALNADTVWLFPEHRLGAILYRGEIVVEDSDALDVATLMIAYENAAEAPRPMAHYLDVMALRTDPKTAALHAFNESQLTPPPSVNELEQQSARHMAAKTADLKKQQDTLDEMNAEFWAQSGMAPPADFKPPQARPAPVEMPSVEAVAAGDFDLSAMMQQTEKLAAEVKKAADEQNQAMARAQADLGAVGPPPPAPVDIEAQWQRVLARAEGKAQAEEMSDMELAANAIADTEQRQRALTQAAEAQVLQKDARRAAMSPTMPAEALHPRVARRLGEQMFAWYKAGIGLRERDCAGADLSGLDFAGADLGGILLENAKLSRTNFNGADLSRAVLAGACLDGATLVGANLADANLCESTAIGATMTEAMLTGSRAVRVKWRHVVLTRAKLDNFVVMNADLAGANLDAASFDGSTLNDVNAPGSYWRGASFHKTIAWKLKGEGGDFSGALLKRSVLLGAELRASLWRDARFDRVQAGSADWRETDLTGMRAETSSWNQSRLVGATLCNGEFRNCDFGRAGLSGADLCRGLFYRSLFMTTDMQSIKAADADFFQAMLRKADLRYADLTGVNLTQAELTETRFAYAKLDGAVIDERRRVA